MIVAWLRPGVGGDCCALSGLTFTGTNYTPRALPSVLTTFFFEDFGSAKAEKQSFQAAPNGLPAGFAIAFAAEKAAQASQAAEELSHGFDRSVVFSQQR